MIGSNRTKRLSGMPGGPFFLLPDLVLAHDGLKLKLKNEAIYRHFLMVNAQVAKTMN